MDRIVGYRVFLAYLRLAITLVKLYLHLIHFYLHLLHLLQHLLLRPEHVHALRSSFLAGMDAPQTSPLALSGVEVVKSWKDLG
mgnify:CR=1 FL=1